MKTLVLLLLSVSLSWSQTDFWQKTDGIMGGAAVLAVAADSDGFAYVSTSAPSELYVSSDDGVHWSASSLQGKDIGSIAGGKGGLVFAAATDGIYRSTNHGVDWSLANSGLDSTTPTCVALSGSGTLYAGTYKRGVFRSTNNGESWEPAGLTGQRALHITLDDAGVLYVNVYNSRPFRSTDAGKTWILMESFPAAAGFAPDHHGGVIASSYSGQIYRSIDSGATWIRKAALITTMADWIVVATDRDGRIFAFEFRNAVFRSTDLGDTWTVVDKRLASTYGFCPAATASGSIIVGTWAAGVFRSDDQGISWRQSSSGFVCPPVWSLARSGSYLFAGTSAGVFRSLHDGVTWTQDDTGAVPFDVSMLGTDPDQALWATSSSLYQSLDNAVSWSKTKSPINPGIASYGFGSIAWTGSGTMLLTQYWQSHTVIDPNTYSQVLRSTDRGTTWSGVLSRYDPSLNSISVVGDSLVFTSNLRSTDDGETWESVIGLDSAFNTVFRDTSGVLFAGSGAGILQSSDSGKSWKQMLTLGVPVHAIIRGPGTPLLAATEGKGVLASTDRGESWKPLNSGLTDSSTFSLMVGPDGHVLVGTWHDGVFRSSDRITSVDPLAPAVMPAYYSLEQNYPNPFNPSTTIRYFLPRRSQVRLAVFNTLGQEVARLIDAEVDAGRHDVVFDAKHLSSGAYFYRIRTGNFTQTRMFLLLR